MTPQKENGYTAIANELMEALAAYPIPASQMQCLLAVLRETYGWDRKTAAISLTRFVDLTKLDRRHAHRALNELVKKNVIKVNKRSAKDGTKLTSMYRLNKIYTSWVFVPKKARGSAIKGTKGSTKFGTSYIKANIKQKRIADSGESAGKEFYLTKKKKKLSGKRLVAFNDFWEAFDFKQGKAAAADSWLEIPTLTNQILEQIISAAKIEASGRQAIIDRGSSPKWAQGWISERRWEDEVYQGQTNLTLEQTRQKYGLAS